MRPSVRRQKTTMLDEARGGSAAAFACWTAAYWQNGSRQIGGFAVADRNQVSGPLVASDKAESRSLSKR